MKYFLSLTVLGTMHSRISLAESENNISDYVPPGQHVAAAKGAASELAIDKDEFRFAKGQGLKALTGIKPESALTTRGATDIQIYKNVSPSVVLVVTDSGLGSGSVVANGKILTSYHVVEGAKQIGIIFKPVQEGEKLSEADLVRAELVKSDITSDLAILSYVTGYRAIKPIELGTQLDVEIGADVHAIGHPTGEAWTYTRGVISQFRKDYSWQTEDKHAHEADVIQTQTPINPGNSGGPLISNSGKLIGVNAFKAQGEGLNFAISVSSIQQFMSRPEKKKEAKPATNCVIYEGKDKANTSYIRVISTTCSNQGDILYRKPDDPKRSIALLLDTTGSGKADVWIYDWNRDGKWDFSLYVSGQDEKITLIGYHPDGKVVATRVEPYRGQPTPWAN